MLMAFRKDVKTIFRRRGRGRGRRSKNAKRDGDKSRSGPDAAGTKQESDSVKKRLNGRKFRTRVAYAFFCDRSVGFQSIRTHPECLSRIGRTAINRRNRRSEMFGVY